MAEPQVEDDDDDDLDIDTHPMATSLAKAAEKTIVIDDDDDDEANQASVLGGKRKRYSYRPSSSGRFEPVRGLTTVARSRTSSLGVLASSSSNVAQPAPAAATPAAAAAADPSHVIDLADDPVGDYAPAPLPPQDEYYAISRVVQTRPELAQSLVLAQALARSLSGSAAEPQHASPKERTARATHVNLTVVHEGHKIIVKVAKDQPLKSFFDVVKSSLQLEGTFSFRTSWGLQLTPEDTPESAALSEGTVVNVTRSVEPPPRPPAARVLNLDATNEVVDVDEEEGDDEDEDDEVDITAPNAAALLNTAIVEEESTNKLTLKFSMSADKLVKASVPRSDTFECILQKFCAKQSLDPKKVKFYLDGAPVALRQTPDECGLDDNVRRDSLHDHHHH